MWSLLGVAAAAGTVLALLVSAPSIYTLLLSLVVMITVIWLAEKPKESRLLGRGKAVLITGCDTGFGHELAHQLDAFGLIVFAGCLSADSPKAKMLTENCSDRLHVLQMDVTDNEQIKTARTYVEEHLPREGLWAVLNNAGITAIGDLELCPTETLRKVAEVNMFGLFQVTKTFLPLIRSSKGRIVNMSSAMTKLSFPLCGAYAMTKCAVDSFSNTLRVEMKRWGVRVIIIEPTNFGAATNLLQAERMQANVDDMWDSLDEGVRDAYGKDYLDHHMKKITHMAEESCINGNLVVEAMTEALLAIEPRIRYLVSDSKTNEIRLKMTAFFPTAWMDKIASNVYREWPLPRALQGKK